MAPELPPVPREEETPTSAQPRAVWARRGKGFSAEGSKAALTEERRDKGRAEQRPATGHGLFGQSRDQHRPQPWDPDLRGGHSCICLPRSDPSATRHCPDPTARPKPASLAVHPRTTCRGFPSTWGLNRATPSHQHDGDSCARGSHHSCRRGRWPSYTRTLLEAMRHHPADDRLALGKSTDGISTGGRVPFCSTEKPHLQLLFLSVPGSSIQGH